MVEQLVGQCPFKGNDKMVMVLLYPNFHICQELVILSDPNRVHSVLILCMYYRCMYFKSTSELKIIKTKS